MGTSWDGEQQVVPNLRDVGGPPAGEGQRVRRGVLLRSALPETTDSVPDGVVWPPAQVIDLRSYDEAGEDHPLSAVAGETVRVSLLEALRPDGPQAVSRETRERMRVGGLAALYLGMLELARPEIVDVVNKIADHDGPTLVHCAAGKDRTGVIIALVLRAVGVARVDVVADYLRTQDAMAAVLQRVHTQAPVAGGHRSPPSYLALPVEAIEAALDLWDEHPGGPAGWLRDVAGDDGLVDRLRRRLLVPAFA